MRQCDSVSSPHLSIGGVGRGPPHYHRYMEGARPAYSYRTEPRPSRRFTNYCSSRDHRDPCTDYLSNPMFNSLHQRGGIRYSGYSNYWAERDKTISLRPLGMKKNSSYAIRSACKV